MSDLPDEQNNKEEELRIGVYICHCGSNIAGVIPPEEVVKFAEGLPDVVHATDTLYACADSGQRLIKEDIENTSLTVWSFPHALSACMSLRFERLFLKRV